MLCESYAIAIDLLFLIIACIGLSNWLHFPVLWQEMLRIWAFLSWIPNDTVTFFFHIGVLKKLCIGHPPAIILVGGPSCLTRCATTNNTTSKACRTLLNRASLGPRWMICTFYMCGWQRARNTYLGASKNRFYLPFFNGFSISPLEIT